MNFLGFNVSPKVTPDGLAPLAVNIYHVSLKNRVQIKVKEVAIIAFCLLAACLCKMSFVGLTHRTEQLVKLTIVLASALYAVRKRFIQLY